MKLADRRVLIVGATSGIAIEILRVLAEASCHIVLVARDSEKVAAVGADLKVRGAGTVETFVMDANDFARHDEPFAFATRVLGGIDIVLIAHGLLAPKREDEAYPDRVLDVFSTTASSVISLAVRAANIFEEQRSGLIVVLSSVAGDRGRRSNYSYGAAKSAVSAFLQGLRARLHGSGARVLTVKPGPVDTPMTSHLRKGFLFASPVPVARKIVRAMERGREVIYVPGYWRGIMFLVRLIPERFAKRLDI